MNDQAGPSIIFMGTPEFAVASLSALLDAGMNVIAVVTAPDKPAGRGMKLNESAVKKFAVARGIPVLQPEKLKSPEFISELEQLKADLQVVVAFRMLPEIVWNMPPQGTINLHGSLLPQYRGAAPINWAIINGEEYTGVTTFKLKHEIDTGNILLREKIPISPDDNAGTLHDKMKDIGAQLLVRTIREIQAGTLEGSPQEELAEGSSLRHAPKIHTNDCRVFWDKPVEQVHNLIRGLSPYPGAFTIINERMMKIYSSEMEIAPPAVTEGDYETDGKTFLKFACANGFLHLKEIQMEGKKKMKIEEFLRGFRM
jgi:methionyl-tRNA formyltransferase